MKFLKPILFLLFIFTAISVHAQSSAELKKERDKLNQQLEQLNKELEQTQNSKQASIKQLDIIKAAISVRQQKIENINSQVKNLDNQITENINTVTTLQKQLSQLKQEYAAMILFAYHNQSAYNKLMFIFAAKDFNQAYKRLKYLQQFGAYRQRQADHITGTEKDLNNKTTQLDKDKKEKENLLSDQKKEKATLGQQKKDQLDVVADLTKHGTQVRVQMQDVQTRLARANRAIKAAIQKEIEEENRKAEEADRLAAKNGAAKAKAEGRDAPAVKVIARRTTSEILNSTPEAARLSNDFLGNRGRLPWPVEKGILNHGFGTYTLDGIRVENTGYEIRTNPGSAVRAVFEGEVNYTANMGGTSVVIIKHGEYFTSYSNLRSVSVSKGQKVSQKQIIGTAGTDPTTGEGELDFSLNKGGSFVDPQIWLTPNK